MCYNLCSLVVSFIYVSYQSSGLLIGTVQISVDSQNISTESSGLLILLTSAVDTFPIDRSSRKKVEIINFGGQN